MSALDRRFRGQKSRRKSTRGSVTIMGFAISQARKRANWSIAKYARLFNIPPIEQRAKHPKNPRRTSLSFAIQATDSRARDVGANWAATPSALPESPVGAASGKEKKGRARCRKHW
jgi:hypothetical protein